MTETKFVYTTYIARSTPELVWDALLKAEITRRYWGHENRSDWQPGSPWQHVRDDAAHTVVLVGTVVEVEKPRRLVITWGDAADAADKSKHTRVTFELEAIDDMVRLTVTHDEFAGKPDMLPKIANGWPRVLSSLKSYLETGRPLDTWAQSRS